jgi:predicted DNA-binding transcriptional regulator AlpA
MPDIVLMSITKDDLQTLIINCVSASLQNVPLVVKSSQPEPDRWLSLKELCEYHPDKPSEATVYFWVRTKTIPFHKNEGQKRLRFLKSEIDDFIKSGKQKTKLEIQQAAERHEQALYTKIK